GLRRTQRRNRLRRSAGRARAGRSSDAAVAASSGIASVPARREGQEAVEGQVDRADLENQSDLAVAAVSLAGRARSDAADAAIRFAAARIRALIRRRSTRRRTR